MTPISLLPVQTGSQSLLFKKIISQQPQEINSQFLHQIVNSQTNIYKKVTIPVQTGSQSLILKQSYLNNHIFTSKKYVQKPEVKVYYLQKIISQQPQEINSQFLLLHHLLFEKKKYSRGKTQFQHGLYFKWCKQNWPQFVSFLPKVFVITNTNL